MYYINCFFIYSFLGFIYESTISLLFHHKFTSGILYGPITPIYGIGVITILIVSKYLFLNLHLPRWRETIIVFFLLSILLSLLEFIGGIFIEKVFGVVFWNYDHMYFHIGHYVSLEIAFLWGFLAIFLIYVINPLLHPFILKIPHIITYISIILCSIDYIITFINLK